MLTASDIFLKYGDRVLFNHFDLTIANRERTGLTGRNGAGKSTLLKVLAKEMKADTGRISIPGNARIGFLQQELAEPSSEAVLDAVMNAHDTLKSVSTELEQVTHDVTVRTDYESDSYQQLLDRLAELTEQHHTLGGETLEADAHRILQGLGFGKEEMLRPIKTFSGGWQMRVELAKLLLSRPDYLFLDEPTNHLDIESIIWLEGFLQTYPGAIIVISHDKTFLDHVTKRTLEIELGNLYDYPVAYTKYLVLRQERREKLHSAYVNQQRVIAEKERTINRFMAKATKTKMAQSMKKQLDKMERIELDVADTAAMNLRFPPATRSGDVALTINKLAKSYGDHLVFSDVDLVLERAERIALVGQNGQGKSTLVKIITGDVAASDGGFQLGHNVQIGYYAQDQSDALDGDMTLIETLEQVAPPELRARVRAILGAFMFSGEDAEKKVKVLSGGERARLALAKLLLKPFNLLILDEPTNHLDLISKDVLKQAIKAYEGTIMVVSHDRDFLAGLTDRTLEFRDGNTYEYLGDVHYFLNKRELDNMRDVELGKTKLAKSAVAAQQPKKKQEKQRSKSEEQAFQKERKKIEKQVKNKERAVSTLESKIKELETKMAQPGFYESPEASQAMQDHVSLQQELDLAMEHWMDAQAAFEELSA